jgi:hypothetical protein
MNKLRTSNAPSPAIGTSSQQPAMGGLPMKRLGSGGGASRAPSSLSIRSRDSPVPKADTGTPGITSVRPELSRTPSAATVTQSRHFLPPASPRQPTQRSFRGTTAASRRAEAVALPTADEPETTVPSPTASESTSTLSSDSDEPPIRQSQLFRRPPPFQRQKKTNLSNVDDIGEDSGDSSPTFLPFATKADGPPQREDPSATLKDTTPPRTRAHPGAVAARESKANTSTPKGKGKQPAGRLESSASSASSAAPPSGAETAHHRRIDALSPKHRAELARLSPRRQGTREGSDGTPSMGSSFSDLDGESHVT